MMKVNEIDYPAPGEPIDQIADCAAEDQSEAEA